MNIGLYMFVCIHIYIYGWDDTIGNEETPNIKNLAFGDDTCHPSMATLGMVYNYL